MNREEKKILPELDQSNKKIVIAGVPGYPITMILFDEPGLFLNVDESDVGLVWEKLRELRNAKDPDASVLFFEPQFQGPLIVTRAALDHIIGVVRGYAAEKRTQLGREKIAVPERFIH